MIAVLRILLPLMSESSRSLVRLFNCGVAASIAAAVLAIGASFIALESIFRSTSPEKKSEMKLIKIIKTLIYLGITPS